MDIPIVRWTDPKSGEAYEDKVREQLFNEPFGSHCSQVYCSDILDAITKDFFARKGGAMDETTHVTDIQVQANFYSEKFSTLFCPRWQRSRTGLGMREPAPPCGSRERSTAPPSYRKPGRITR